MAEARAAFRILLVDDDEVDRRVIRRTLRDCGLAVGLEETSDPQHGIALVRAERYDCVLLDYRFPTGDAFDLWGEVLAQSCARRPVIILLTGAGDERVAAEAIHRGAQEYLTKSALTPATIRRAIEAAHERAALQREIEWRNEQLTRMSFHDPLTGLPNRQLFFDRLGQALRDAARNAKSFPVLMMDLNLFKAVNDSYGHEAGDELLRQVAERLRRVLRDSDTVARLGGDEFAAVLSTAYSLEGAVVVGEKICAAIGEPFLVCGHIARVGISVGITLYPDHGETAELLLRHADMAMYAGKVGDCGVTVFDPDEDGGRYEPALVAQGLKTALEDGELFALYQPQISFADGAVIGVEALVRWRHPQLGLLPPGKFIPAAERFELIEALTYLVLETSLAQIHRWRERGLELSVSVNLSTRLLYREGLAERLGRRVREAGVAPKSLLLEVTETGLTQSPEQAERTLCTLSALGVGISIDDFGTGYSSLKYLRNFPIDEIKIDGSFVSNLYRDARDALFVESIVTLGNAYGVRVIAEGVEDEALWARLRELGCRFGQGYAFGAPMEPAELERWHEAWVNGRARENAKNAAHAG